MHTCVRYTRHLVIKHNSDANKQATKHERTQTEKRSRTRTVAHVRRCQHTTHPFSPGRTTKTWQHSQTNIRVHFSTRPSDTWSQKNKADESHSLTTMAPATSSSVDRTRRRPRLHPMTTRGEGRRRWTTAAHRSRRILTQRREMTSNNAL